MPIQALCVTGFRSIKHVYIPLQRINVIVGPNGVGKTNLYRAIEILHFAATGEFAHAIARKGGMQSVLC